MAVHNLKIGMFLVIYIIVRRVWSPSTLAVDISIILGEMTDNANVTISEVSTSPSADGTKIY